MAVARQESQVGIGRYWNWITAALLISCLAVSGCSTASWQRYQESPANPGFWIRSLFPPEGETFYSDQAQQIDRHLRRDRAE